MPFRLVILLLVMSSFAPGPALAADRWSIAYPDTAPEGLVGNGRSVVRVRPDGIDFHSGGDASARFRLVCGDSTCELTGRPAGAMFVPGAVAYRLTAAGAQVEILHAARPDVPWLAIVRVRDARGPVAIEVAAKGSPPLARTGRIEIPLREGRGEVVLAAGAPAPAIGWDSLLAAAQQPYRTGLVLETPSAAIDRAVPFCRALLDVGFDGRMHVCEIFRWRDVWSRDLGSGLAVGALASGRFADAAATIDYDLARHAKADPRGLKVTQDPSQGGTAEGVAWLTNAVWRQYLLTGDAEALRAAVRTLRPWVDAWLDRDADERGLLVDVSEWMDHSRFFLFPDGARILYSNVLFAGLLRRFAALESEVADTASARRYAEAARRFDRGINATLWDEANGMYDNLELWGRRDERCSSAENALAVLCGVAPESRARRALATVRERNWRSAGSTTIHPPMSHVPLYIDHNFKVWPWWEAVEARARCRIGDREGALWLLECCAATLEDEHYPGMMEELTSPEGRTEGGFAFLTAAGSYLDAIVLGLLGVEVVEPGCRGLRVAPNTPAGWRDWRAEVPLPQGAVVLTQRAGRLRIRVTDPRVVTVEAPRGAVVEGARRVLLRPRPFPVLEPGPAPSAPPLEAPRARRAVRLVADRLPPAPFAAPPVPALRDADLVALDPAAAGAVIVTGNAMPRRTTAGHDLPGVLSRYLDRGGALVFYGATMQDRGTMGEKGGVIEWYEPRPAVRYEPIGGWTFHASGDRASVPQPEESGLRAGWHQPAIAPDAAWKPIEVPAPWEKAMGRDYDGWGWYRAAFVLPADARGRVVVLNLGRIDDNDWTYVNGQLVGRATDWQAIRRYRLVPGDAAYDALTFGGPNQLAVQVQDTGGGGGMFADVPRVGVETDSIGWQPVDPLHDEIAEQPMRHGVVSWGPGGAFFNSWETSRGAFGFAIEGRGVEFAGPLAGLPALDEEVREAFTDFAVSLPWRFEPLAFTRTRRGLLVPDEGERYPCAARLVNTKTGGEIVLLPASIVRAGAGPQVLERLRIGGKP